MSILWSCEPATLRVPSDMIDGLIPAVIPIELRPHFLCLVINQILNHLGFLFTLSIKPSSKSINRSPRDHLCKTAHSREVAAIRGGLPGDSARSAAKARQDNDPNAVVIPMARSTGICERASTPNTKIVVILHTTRP
jgi:hypothetical protein